LYGVLNAFNHQIKLNQFETEKIQNNAITTHKNLVKSSNFQFLIYELADHNKSKTGTVHNAKNIIINHQLIKLQLDIAKTCIA
jgi:hypothetical protein